MIRTKGSREGTGISYIDWGNLADKFTPAGYVGDWELVAMLFIVPMLMLLAKKWSWFIVFLVLDGFLASMIMNHMNNGNNPKGMVIFWGIIVLLYCISLISIMIGFYKKRTIKR